MKKIYSMLALTALTFSNGSINTFVDCASSSVNKISFNVDYSVFQYNIHSNHKDSYEYKTPISDFKSFDVSINYPMFEKMCMAVGYNSSYIAHYLQSMNVQKYVYAHAFYIGFVYNMNFNKFNITPELDLDLYRSDHWYKTAAKTSSFSLFKDIAMNTLKNMWNIKIKFTYSLTDCIWAGFVVKTRGIFTTDSDAYYPLSIHLTGGYNNSAASLKDLS